MSQKYLIAGILIASFLAIGQHFAIQEREVQAADDSNFFSDVGNAINAGRDAGEEDAEAGRIANCDGGIAFCQGYYEAYNAEKLVGGN